MIEVHEERIPNTLRLIQQRGRAYVAFFLGGGYRPTPPNPNVVGVASWVLDETRFEEYFEYHSYKPQIALEVFVFPPTVVVPNVIGLDVQDALTALGNVFLLGTVSLQDLDLSVPYNTVNKQSIAAGTSVGQGTIVNLVAQDLTIVPNVMGLPKAAALAAINAAFLQSAVLTQVSIPPLGVVLLQSLLPGTGALANTVVTITISISGDGFRVQAVTAGWYNGTYYNVGDVFDLLHAADFSDSTLNYEIAGGEYTAGWMIQVNPATPLTQDDGNAFFPAVDPNRRFVD